MDKIACGSLDDLIEELAFLATDDDRLEYKPDVIVLRIGIVVVGKAWLTLRLSYLSKDPKGKSLLEMLTRSQPAFLRKLQAMARRRRLRRKLERERG
jgi:hypothetical protein